MLQNQLSYPSFYLLDSVLTVYDNVLKKGGLAQNGSVNEDICCQDYQCEFHPRIYMVERSNFLGLSSDLHMYAHKSTPHPTHK